MVIAERPKLSLFDRLYIGAVLKGMLITLRHALRNLFNPNKMMTVEYPEMKKPLPDNYRSEHRLMQRPDETPRCTACMLCATACPADCIEIVAEEHPDPRVEKFPAVYNINLLRCVYCSLCVEACPCDAIRMDTKKIEQAGYTREHFIVDKDYLLNNHPEDKSPYSIALY